MQSPVLAADGSSTVADVVYVDRASGQRAILEVSIVTVRSDTALVSSSRIGLEGAKRCCGRAKRRNAITASSGSC